ncbi:MAG: hypothetical protein WA130_11275 [Candidatus Methanoperedens sp.]|jgi:hypothetical protein
MGEQGEQSIRVLNITPNAILLLEIGADGKETTRFIPANTFNSLKYIIKGLFEGMVGRSHTKIWLGDNCVISPTTQEYVFCLEYNGRLVHTTPDMDKVVCRAILRAHTEQDFKPFIELFNELYAKRQKSEFLELFMVVLGDRVRAAVMGGLSGYVVDKEFFVAQNGNAFRIVPPEKGEDGKPDEQGRLDFLCIVPRDHQIKPQNLSYNNARIVLGQQEQVFISKVMMLLNREKHKNDSVFWRQIQPRQEGKLNV